MNKNIFIFSLLLLSSCSAPGSAFLGPIFTGAKTGSISQASLSYSSGKLIEEIDLKNSLKKLNALDNNNNKLNPILPDVPYTEKDPVILLSYKIKKIEISEVIEPEPLP
mgnify:CR=1 FL=1